MWSRRNENTFLPDTSAFYAAQPIPERLQQLITSMAINRRGSREGFQKPQNVGQQRHALRMRMRFARTACMERPLARRQVRGMNERTRRGRVMAGAARRGP